MCTKFVAWIAGEQLRIRMHTENVNLIKDRKYHFRTYHNCFKSPETIDWLLERRQCPTREAAVFVMRILQQYGVFHHVCDDHLFKDEMLFYRFRKDDRTWIEDRDSIVFHRGEKIFNWLVCKKLRGFKEDLLSSSIQNGLALSFCGKELIDWFIKVGETYSAEGAIRLGKELVDYDIIRHVRDEYDFKDGWIPYSFNLNYRQQIPLTEMLKSAVESDNIVNTKLIYVSQLKISQKTAAQRRKQSSESDADSIEHRSSTFHRTLSVESKASKDDESDGLNDIRSSHTEHEFMSSTEDFAVQSIRSVLIRHATIQELEDPDTPYIKKMIRVFGDSVGYGCVIRGEKPTYVQTVDPTGPASTAGIKVRQYIYSVNGEKVLGQNHKYVAKAIMRNNSHVDLEVMSHIRDASM